MFRSTVCWANLGIELPDGRLPRTESYVWSSAQSLPDLSGTRSDKVYASESRVGRDDHSSDKDASGPRKARGRQARVALIHLFLRYTGPGVADSTRV